MRRNSNKISAILRIKLHIFISSNKEHFSVCLFVALYFLCLNHLFQYPDASYDFASWDRNPEDEYGMVQWRGHGTKVAGIACAVDGNHKCGHGIAFKAKIAGNKFSFCNSGWGMYIISF